MTNPDFLFGITPGDYDYDIETYPNCFTIGLMHRVTKQRWLFEISDRRNDIVLFCAFLDVLGQHKCRMFGFNSIGFDYPVIHFIYKNQRVGITVEDIYNKAMTVIKANGPAKFAHMVWQSDWIVDQIDLFKIHHFDNVSKFTSLKVLEFNMQMGNIEDLPFPVGTVLTDDQKDILIHYMWHDIDATDLFADKSQSEIAMRERLSETFSHNMMNMSDVKIGETILIKEMESRGLKCYDYSTGKKQKIQTKRSSIDLADAIFPYIQLEHPEFVRVHDFLKSKTITETKGAWKDLIAVIDGIEYKIGTGGIHASVESTAVHSTETHQLVDVDVASFYPNMAIQNELYPAHLGKAFCDAYLGVYHTRKKYDKGTPENGAFKLALNGAYGGSNNEHSPFFDSLFTMTITISGQLSLCMLIEQMLKIPGLRMIQANTDGITYLCPREYLTHSRQICTWWESVTKLELEEALYSRMFIRDVNSYIAEYESGKLKRIGAYAHVTALEDPGTRELPWHKDWSSRVVALAAEAALVRGEDIREFVTSHTDIHDFFLRTKVPRNSTLEWGGDQVSNIVRYYISTGGDILEKVMPPKGPEGEYKRANKLTDTYFDAVMAEIGPGVWDERIHTKNKSTYEWRRTGINTGWTVQLCNDLATTQETLGFNDVNHEWYIKEAEKLVKPLID